MNNKLAEKQIWTIKTKDEIYNPRLGVVYREIVKDYSYEIMLASTELDLISDADMIMPTKHTTLPYSISVHANQIFPALTDAEFLQNQIGTIDNTAHEQLKQLRNESRENIEIKFEVGGPIIFHSDRRYSMMLHNLSIVNQLGQDALSTVFINIPDNVVPLITFKSKKEINIIEALDTKLKNRKVETHKIFPFTNILLVILSILDGYEFHAKEQFLILRLLVLNDSFHHFLGLS